MKKFASDSITAELLVLAPLLILGLLVVVYLTPKEVVARDHYVESGWYPVVAGPTTEVNSGVSSLVIRLPNIEPPEDSLRQCFVHLCSDDDEGWWRYNKKTRGREVYVVSVQEDLIRGSNPYATLYVVRGDRLRSYDFDSSD